MCVFIRPFYLEVKWRLSIYPSTKGLSVRPSVDWYEREAAEGRLSRVQYKAYKKLILIVYWLESFKGNKK